MGTFFDYSIDLEFIAARRRKGETMDPPTLKATPQDMADNLLPMHARDYCADVLIPLNKCRRKSLYAPWACHDLMHSYEICMYKEYERRREIKKQG